MTSDSCNAPLVTGWWHPACHLVGISGAIQMRATYLLASVHGIAPFRHHIALAGCDMMSEGCDTRFRLDTSALQNHAKANLSNGEGLNPKRTRRTGEELGAWSNFSLLSKTCEFKVQQVRLLPPPPRSLELYNCMVSTRNRFRP